MHDPLAVGWRLRGVSTDPRAAGQRAVRCIDAPTDVRRLERDGAGVQRRAQRADALAGHENAGRGRAAFGQARLRALLKSRAQADCARVRGARIERVDGTHGLVVFGCVRRRGAAVREPSRAISRRVLVGSCTRDDGEERRRYMRSVRAGASRHPGANYARAPRLDSQSLWQDDGSGGARGAYPPESA